MGGWPSQLVRHLSTTSTVRSDTQAIEAPSVVLREEMAARTPVSPMENGEHNVSAASRIMAPEKLSRITSSLQEAQEVISLVPSILEHQRELEAKIANHQRYN